MYNLAVFVNNEESIVNDICRMVEKILYGRTLRAFLNVTAVRGVLYVQTAD